jgi:hypothetical protein
LYFVRDLVFTWTIAYRDKKVVGVFVTFSLRRYRTDSLDIRSQKTYIALDSIAIKEE